MGAVQSMVAILLLNTEQTLPKVSLVILEGLLVLLNKRQDMTSHQEHRGSIHTDCMTFNSSQDPRMG
jgi:pantothenate kinase